MKTTLAVTALMLPVIALAAPPGAVVIQDQTEYARVLGFTPISGPPVARQVCGAPVTTPAPAQHSTGGAILGGLTGALVGSRFGEGHGRDAATVAGAIGGALVGDRVGAANSSETVTQQSCETVYEAGPPAGYQVNYEYQGQRGTVTLRHPPGDYVKVHRVVTVD
jgi:uncharacterized protein YcfJ